jgi:hypothetical protein
MYNNLYGGNTMQITQRKVDTNDLEFKLMNRPRVKDAINYYFEELVENNVDKNIWQNVKHAEYNTVENMFGRKFVDPLKNIDVDIMTDLIRMCMQHYNKVLPQWDYDFLKKVELKVESKEYNKATKSNHSDKWRLMMILIENAQ